MVDPGPDSGRGRWGGRLRVMLVWAGLKEVRVTYFWLVPLCVVV